MRGIDYAWADPKPSSSCLKSNDVRFIMRYFSYDLSKDLTQDELNNAVAAGIAVGVVWETTANRMLAGKSAGITDAKEADRRAQALGMSGVPIYFACDWDASESEQPTINAYMDGVISVIGKSRTGIYAGYYPGKRTLDAGKAAYLWQTYAWSGGQWDDRAQLRQVQNGVTVCSTSADWDESHAEDFGQWPRPTTAAPEGDDMPLSPADAKTVWQSVKWNEYIDEDGSGVQSRTPVDILYATHRKAVETEKLVQTLVDSLSAVSATVGNLTEAIAELAARENDG